MTITADLLVRATVAAGSIVGVVVLILHRRVERRDEAARHALAIALGLPYPHPRKWRPVALLGRIVLLLAIGYAAVEAQYRGLPTGPRNFVLLLGVSWLAFGELMDLVERRHKTRHRRKVANHDGI